MQLKWNNERLARRDVDVMRLEAKLRNSDRQSGGADLFAAYTERLAEELLRYMDADRKSREKALDELAALSQEMGMGY